MISHFYEYSYKHFSVSSLSVEAIKSWFAHVQTILLVDLTNSSLMRPRDSLGTESPTNE